MDGASGRVLAVTSPTATPRRPGDGAADPVAVVATTAADVTRKPVELPRRVPGPAGAVPVAESALAHVLAARGPGSGVAAASDLLRNVEALLRAEAPPGMPASELRSAAARLVEQQGLVGRLASRSSSPYETPVTDRPQAVDTRL